MKNIKTNESPSHFEKIELHDYFLDMLVKEFSFFQSKLNKFCCHGLRSYTSILP